MGGSSFLAYEVEDNKRAVAEPLARVLARSTDASDMVIPVNTEKVAQSNPSRKRASKAHTWTQGLVFLNAVWRSRNGLRVISIEI